MNKLEKLLAIGLVATGISVAPAHSQTCTVPPSCDALGFTKSTTDCVGMDTLRCPFDQSKVFCSKTTASSGSGAAGNSDNPLAAIGSYNTYEPGSKFYDDKGEFLGYFVGEGNNYVFDFSREFFTKRTDAINHCANKTTGGLTWSTPSSSTWVHNNGKAIYNVVKGMRFISYTDNSHLGYSYYMRHDEYNNTIFSSNYYYNADSPISMHVMCITIIKTYY